MEPKSTFDMLADMRPSIKLPRAARRYPCRPRRGLPGGYVFVGDRPTAAEATTRQCERAWELRNRGLSFARIEEKLRLRPANGMTAYRCYLRWLRPAAGVPRRVR